MRVRAHLSVRMTLAACRGRSGVAMSIRAIHLTPGTPRGDLSRRINFLDRCFERHPDFILRRIFHGVPKPVRKVRDPFLDHSKIPDKQIRKGHSEDPPEGSTRDHQRGSLCTTEHFRRTPGRPSLSPNRQQQHHLSASAGATRPSVTLRSRQTEDGPRATISPSRTSSR